LKKKNFSGKNLKTTSNSYMYDVSSTNPLNYVDFLHARQSRSKFHFVLA